MTFVIYTVPNCVYCVKAKELLRNKEYTEVLLDKNEFVEKVNKYTRGVKQIKTAPQITFSDQLIGGYTELSHYLVNNSDSFNDSNDF